MPKYKEINLSVGSVETLMKMSADLKEKYDEYARAGSDIFSYYDVVSPGLGIDAEAVYDLLERLNDELVLNCQEILDLGTYCETLAKRIEEKIGSKLIVKTNFI